MRTVMVRLSWYFLFGELRIKIFFFTFYFGKRRKYTQVDNMLFCYVPKIIMEVGNGVCGHILM